MERKGFVLIVTTIFLVLAVHVLAAEEILTNETIVTMVKAGVGEELIISKIQSSQNQFDVSTDSILKLKAEGVNEKTIKAMVEASKPKAPTAPQPTGTVTITRQDVFYLKSGEKMLPIPPVIPQMQVSKKKMFIPHYMGSHDVWHFIRGEKSIVRTNDKNPLFYTKMNPSGFLLVKLAYQKSHDIRFAVSAGGIYKATIPIGFKEGSEGLFELFPKADLLPAEYAFVMGGQFYDFGIDE